MKKFMLLSMLLFLTTLSYSQVKELKTTKVKKVQLVDKKAYSNYSAQLKKAIKKQDIAYSKKILREIINRTNTDKKAYLMARSKKQGSLEKVRYQTSITINEMAIFAMIHLDQKEDYPGKIDWEKVLKILSDVLEIVQEYCC